MMGTFGLGRDTRNPFRKAISRLSNIGEGLDLSGVRWEGETFTQEQVTEQINTAVAASKSGAGNFFEGFAPDVKSHPTITRYKSTEELAKGHIELEKKIGLKGVLVPSDGSSDEVKNKFFTDIGRPEKSEGYVAPVIENLHESVKETSETDAKIFRDKAFELGLSSKQFSGLYDWYMSTQSQRLNDWDKFQKDEHNKVSTELRNKWGGKYEGNVALANGLVQKFGSEALVDDLRKNPNPRMIEFLANLGSQLSEDKLGELGASHMGKTPEQAKQEIAKIQGNSEHAYNKGSDPLHDEAVKEMQSLYKIAYSKPAG